MGIDVGERRIGIAIGDELGMIASPLQAMGRGEGDLAAIRALAESRQVDRLVVGLPTTLSGREGPQAAAVRAFANALAEEVGPAIRVEFWDERLSTAAAERSLRDSGKRRRARDGTVDAMAAAVILQGYLDARRTRRPCESPMDEPVAR
jgi:putative Holliday junction resolvase